MSVSLVAAQTTRLRLGGEGLAVSCSLERFRLCLSRRLVWWAGCMDAPKVFRLLRYRSVQNLSPYGSKLVSLSFLSICPSCSRRHALSSMNTICKRSWPLDTYLCAIGFSLLHKRELCQFSVQVCPQSKRLMSLCRIFEIGDGPCTCWRNLLLLAWKSNPSLTKASNAN